ncbi:type I-E CRISPR-associated protein Cse1/CasA, partial [Rothia nasimurium]
LQVLKENRLINADQEVRVELIGFVYGPQSSIITNSIHEVVPFKLRTLIARDSPSSDRIVQAARRAVEASINLGQFAGFLAEAAGGTYAFVPSATESALNKLETRFKDWLLTVTPDTDLAQRLNTWCDT